MKCMNNSNTSCCLILDVSEQLSKSSTKPLSSELDLTATSSELGLVAFVGSSPELHPVIFVASSPEFNFDSLTSDFTAFGASVTGTGTVSPFSSQEISF